MLLGLGFLSERFSTRVTLEWLLSCVNQHVLLTLRFCGKSALTNRTNVWLFTGVRQIVAIQVRFIGEASVAVFALVRFLSCVTQAMFRQV